MGVCAEHTRPAVLTAPMVGAATGESRSRSVCAMPAGMALAARMVLWAPGRVRPVAVAVVCVLRTTDSGAHDGCGACFVKSRYHD